MTVPPEPSTKLDKLATDCTDVFPAGVQPVVKSSSKPPLMSAAPAEAENRRKGIGSALCEALMEQAITMGYTHMRLATALEPPKALYQSLGFKEIAAYRDVPNEIKNVVHMEIKLV